MSSSEEDTDLDVIEDATSSGTQENAALEREEEGNSDIGPPKKRINKHQLNEGLCDAGGKYFSMGKFREKKEIGEDCKCKYECFNVISLEQRLHILTTFWELADYHLQTAYLHGRLLVEPVKRRKADSRRNNTVYYTVLVNTNIIKVCKKAFLSIHGLQRSRGRVEMVARYLAEGPTSEPKDLKRKQVIHVVDDYSDDERKDVLEHLQFISKYGRRYSRRDNLGKVSSGHTFSIGNLYAIYCQKNDSPPICESMYRYRQILETLGVGFKLLPQSDTLCKMCDSLIMRLNGDASEEERKQLLIKQKLHQQEETCGHRIVKLRSLVREEEDEDVMVDLSEIPSSLKDAGARDNSIQHGENSDGKQKAETGSCSSGEVPHLKAGPTSCGLAKCKPVDDSGPNATSLAPSPQKDDGFEFISVGKIKQEPYQDCTAPVSQGGGEPLEGDDPPRLTERHFISSMTRREGNCFVCAHTTRRATLSKQSRFECVACKVCLCIEPCFKEYHTQKQF